MDKMPGSPSRLLRREPRRKGASYASIVGPEKARESAEQKRERDERAARLRMTGPAVRGYFADWARWQRENRPFS